MADPSLIADVSMPTAAAGIAVLVVRMAVHEVRELYHRRNGGTLAEKTVAALESIDAKMDTNGAKLDAIATGVVELRSHNVIADAVAAAVVIARREERDRHT